MQRCRRLASGRTDLDSALLLDGPHLLAVALAAGWPVELVSFTADAVAASAEAAALVDQAAGAGIPLVPVTAAVMEAMSPVVSPTGILALGAAREHTLGDLARPAPALVIGIVDVQDPGNVGAILRSADAFGATGAACLGTSADPYGWKALRGSMGSALRLPVVRARDARACVRALRAMGLTVLVTGTRRDEATARPDWQRPLLLVVGSEGRGVPPEIVAEADGALVLPMRDGVDSLNVAVAAGILLHAAHTRREGRPVT